MKLFRIAASWQDKHTLYEDETGYIKGYQMDDGRWSIMEFFIKPEYRGKGLAKELAKHLPWKCRLYAQPLGKGGLGVEPLMKFYESLGFKTVPKGMEVNDVQCPFMKDCEMFRG